MDLPPSHFVKDELQNRTLIVNGLIANIGEAPEKKATLIRQPCKPIDIVQCDGKLEQLLCLTFSEEFYSILVSESCSFSCSHWFV